MLCVLVFGIRALIPTGYMYGTADGHTGLILCPAGLHHDVAAHPMAGMHGGHGMQSAEQCPFALAGGAALRAAGRAPLEPYFLIVHPARAQIVASVPRAPPSRYHAPRGPPSLA